MKKIRAIIRLIKWKLKPLTIEQEANFITNQIIRKGASYSQLEILSYLNYIGLTEEEATYLLFFIEKQVLKKEKRKLSATVFYSNGEDIKIIPYRTTVITEKEANRLFLQDPWGGQIKTLAEEMITNRSDPFNQDNIEKKIRSSYLVTRIRRRYIELNIEAHRYNIEPLRIEYRPIRISDMVKGVWARLREE